MSKKTIKKATHLELSGHEVDLLMLRLRREKTADNECHPLYPLLALVEHTRSNGLTLYVGYKEVVDE